MTRAAVTQVNIKRAIKAVKASGVAKVIEITKDGSLLILDPENAGRGKKITERNVDYDGKINL